jgi:DNA polymerase-1
MKYDVKVLARYGIDVAPIDDTMLMSYAMNAGLHGHGMDALAERYLGHQPIPIKELIGSGKSQITFDRVEIDKAAPYAAEDADVTLRLWHLFKPQLHRAQVTTVYETLERPLVPVLARMERSGIKVDRDTLSAACPTPSPRRWRGWRRRSMSLAGRRSTSAPPRSWARSCSRRWGSRAARRARPGSIPRRRRRAGGPGDGTTCRARVLDWRQLSS